MKKRQDIFFVKIKPLPPCYRWNEKIKRESSYINFKEIKEVKVFQYKDKDGKTILIKYGVYIYGSEFPYEISKTNYERLTKL